MAQMPACPNFKEKNCPQSELIMLEETDACWKFHCKCCKLLWMVSKPKTKDHARELNRIKKLAELSERERGKIIYSIGGGAPR